MTRDMRKLDYAELRSIMGEQPYPLLFATVSGAHLYGFPSRDSEVDLVTHDLASSLPEGSSADAGLHDLLVRVRLSH